MNAKAIFISSVLIIFNQACTPLPTVPEFAPISESKKVQPAEITKQLLHALSQTETPSQQPKASPDEVNLTKGKIIFPGSTSKQLFTFTSAELTTSAEGFKVPFLGHSINLLNLTPLNSTLHSEPFVSSNNKSNQLQTEYIHNLTYKLNETVIPEGQVLTQKVFQNSSGDIEISFVTNVIPEQDHLIFSATSPSGQVIMGQYLESAEDRNLILSIEETAIALIKSTPEGAKHSIDDIRQSHTLPKLISNLNQNLQQDLLPTSILDTNSTKQIVESSLRELIKTQDQDIKDLTINQTNTISTIHEVIINDTFGQNNVNIATGESIKWKSLENVTLISGQHLFENQTLSKDDLFSFTFKTSGKYRFKLKEFSSLMTVIVS